MGTLITASRRKKIRKILRAAALEYGKVGFQVFPAHSPINGRCSCEELACGSVAKHPHIDDWPNRATSDQRTIGHYWDQWPDANIGIKTGDGLVVLDVDKNHGGFESLALLEAEYGPLPITVTVKTGGGGRHFYMRSAQPVRNSIGKLGDGLDIRGDGGYIIAPPSLHRSGRPYHYLVGSGPNERQIAEMPPQIVELLADCTSNERSSPRDYSGLIGDGIREGTRNNSLASLIGHLLRRGVNAHLILPLAHAWNQTHNRPPLPDDEVARTVQSIVRKEIRRLGKMRND